MALIGKQTDLTLLFDTDLDPDIWIGRAGGGLFDTPVGTPFVCVGVDGNVGYYERTDG